MLRWSGGSLDIGLNQFRALNRRPETAACVSAGLISLMHIHAFIGEEVHLRRDADVRC
jgi:hypothetical protein